MPLTPLGTLPASAVDLGASLGAAALAARVEGLQRRALSLQAAATAQVTVRANPPQVADLAAGLAVQLAALPTFALPTVFASAALDATATATADLALVEAQLAVVSSAQAQLQAGLGAGGLALWSYAGPAAGLGGSFQVVRGWDGVGPTTPVQGVVVAAEDAAAWRAFGASINVGGTEQVGAGARLRHHGVLGGGQVCVGAAGALRLVDAHLGELRAQRATLAAQLRVAAGLEFPPIAGLEAGLAAAISAPAGLLDNLLTVQTDFAAELSAVAAELGVVLDLSARLQLSLSAGGFTVWSYAGPAAGLGAELLAATARGLPSGSGPGAQAYGIVLATHLPEAWSAFSLVFRT